MKKITLISVGAVMLLSVSCMKQDIVDSNANANTTPLDPVNGLQLSSNQALAYASLFSNNMDKSADESRGIESPKEVGDVSYYVEGKDTLFYAVNYKNDEGFILLSGDNSSFPIIAHASKGKFDFSKTLEGSPLKSVLEQKKDEIKRNLHDPSKLKTSYYENWKDLGNPDFQYEIVPTSAEPQAELRATRRHSSGRESVYPETGKALDTWSQGKYFSEYSENQAAIGCPSVAIAMLLYDCQNRFSGKRVDNTTPYIPFFVEQIDSVSESAKSLSRVFRQIADSIPNYHWGASRGRISGANPTDILVGLKKLGFKSAELVPFDIDLLYKNLRYKAKNYLGEDSNYERGILIGGCKYDKDGYGLSQGHIWFCDGYYEQSYKVTKKFLFVKLKTWTEYDDRLYMNWGWGPNKGNGWYCASDRDWTSKEGNPNINLKYQPMMFINLHEYENNKI